MYKPDSSAYDGLSEDYTTRCERRHYRCINWILDADDGLSEDDTTRCRERYLMLTSCSEEEGRVQTVYKSDAGGKLMEDTSPLL